MDKEDMILSVRAYLSRFGKVDEGIIKAMQETDRKRFMQDEYKDRAYIDTAMPIGHGQTISQPSTVARMLSLLELKKGNSVLEIGTGSGWNASLISFLVGREGKVTSLELYEELVEKAKQNIKKLNTENIEIRKEDFRDLKERFDKIIFTAGILLNQENLIKKFAESHLKENGILVCPFQVGPLIILKNKDGNIEEDFTIDEYVFVPLVL